MIVLIIFGLLFHFSFGAQLPICKAVKYSGVVAVDDEHWNVGATVYTYSFKMKIAFDSENEAYPNKITVSDFEDWSSNTTLYYRTSPISFIYGFFNGPGHYINCTYLYETCDISIPNGQISRFFNFNYNTYGDIKIYGNEANFNDGEILNGDQGYVLDQSNPCMSASRGSGFGIYHVGFNETICCTEYDYIETPDRIENLCEEFTSTTTVIDKVQNFNLALNVVNNIHKDSPYYTNMSISTNMVEMPSNVRSYTIYATDVTVCSGNSSTPQLNCETNLSNNKNLQWIFILNLYGKNGVNYDGIMLGEINRRNRIYLKHDYQPFTVNDKCSSKSVNLPYTTAIYNSTFCCSRFKGDVVPTTTTVLPNATTTTVPLTTTTKPSTDPKSNLIGSLCSNDTSQAWLDIVFVIDTSKVMSKRELNALSAELSTYMHNFTFAQTGNHTVRAAIIGYASDVTTYYQLTDTINYDAFVDALFDFADHGNSDDTGGNLQGALQQAYSLLQSQKSQRRQLIVLVAANYNPTGFQGADVTANSIKDNGICIVVINYKSSQGVLATALQNISCPGYYYISDDDDLNLKFTYALTQLNCICPPGSLQFREYNTAWKNYTNYGDCLFGFNENTDPAMAQRSCHPGVLVAVTSQNKLDVITDHVIPYLKTKKKMFTIGLHKSASDNGWKWWGYNSTEYSFGDFPSMTAASSVNDNYGYLWNNYGFNWTLQTGNNVALPYICQIRACDAEYICDQTQTKNLKHKIAFKV